MSNENKIDKNVDKIVVTNENEAKKENSTNTPIQPTAKKRIESMSDEEIIQENLKELLEKKSRDERRANGRFVAVVIAFLVIFLAIYHAWIRKTAGLAGILLPAGIMLTYGSWIVILAKRDKQKKAMFKKHLEEVALKNKAELEERAKLKQAKRKSGKKNAAKETTLHFENEIKPQCSKESASDDSKAVGGSAGGHRKHRDRQRLAVADGDSGNCSSGSGSSGTSSSRHNSSDLATRDLRMKRPSIRQKLFRQNASTNPQSAAVTSIPGTAVQIPTPLKQKKKRLQRLEAVSMPQMVRMSSAP